MKKIKGVLVFVAAVLVGGTLVGNREWYQAQLLTSPTENTRAFSELLGITSTFKTPESPDFLNTFNVYRDSESEGQLVIKHADKIVAENSEFVKEYANEIMSYVDRISRNPELMNKLPMYPEENVATMGNVIAYLFPNEANPMVFAKENGIVPADAKSESYLSRAQFLGIIAKIFITSDRDALAVLFELGFIDSERTWNNESRTGFKLVEAIRLVLNIRELIERKNILESKKEYAQKTQDLDLTTVKLNEESLQVLINAFSEETASTVDASMLKVLRQRFQRRFDETLTAGLVTQVREVFFRELQERIPPVYQLPPLQLIGDCTNEVFRKTFMGSVAVTGEQGASIICGKMMVRFPANAYLLNIYSLPKISETDSGSFRTDVIRSYENALVITAEGERKISVIYRPGGLDQLIGKSFELELKDHSGFPLTDVKKTFTEPGAVLNLHPRMLSGDHLIKFSLQK